MSYGQTSYGELSYGEDYLEIESGLSETISESVTVEDVLSVNWTSNPVVSATIGVSDTPSIVLYEVSSDGCNISVFETGYVTLFISEILSSSDNIAVSVVFSDSQSDGITVLDLFGTLDIFLENISITESHQVLANLKNNLFHILQVRETWKNNYLQRLVESLQIYDLVDFSFINHIIDILLTGDTLTSQADRKVFLVDSITDSDRVFLSIPVSVLDGAGIDDATTITKEQIISILDSLRSGDTSASAGVFIINQDEVVRLSDIINTDAFEVLIASLTGSDNLLIRLVASMALQSAMEVSEALSQSVEAFLEAVSDLALNDSNSTQTDAVVSVAENINISHLFDPVNMKAWVMNPENYAVYNYTLGFTQTARFGSDYLMADDTGLFQLGGVDDNGNSIIPTITTAALDFGTASIKQVPSILLGTNGTDFILKVSIDGQSTVHYQINQLPTELGTKRLKIGKGLVGRNWQFTLIADNNSEFDIDSFEFYPIIFKRKHNG